MTLNKIVENKRQEIEKLKRHIPLTEMVQLAEKGKGERRSLSLTLSTPKELHLICELKKASPSEGLLREDFKPKVLAQEFEAAGACAISVLTERQFFQGDPGYLREIRPLTTIPLLRKDFIIEPYQVYETVTLGADAFLLIAMLFDEITLRQLIRLGESFGLEALVEVHTKEELEMAAQAGAKIIGLNNRDLNTLKVDLNVSETLFPLVPWATPAVIESGIEIREEIARFQELGASCFLVGTALMKSSDVKQKIKELSGK